MSETPAAPAVESALAKSQRLVGAEVHRMRDDYAELANWRRWGPYVSCRQWGTVREDYSADGNAWNSFPHDDARSRAYRWGEDGLAGWCDKDQNICLSVALWNGKDAILKINPRLDCAEHVVGGTKDPAEQ